MMAAVLATTGLYLDPIRPLLLAIIRAEGGEAAFVRAVQCSRPDVRDLPTALAIACKTVRNRIFDFETRQLGPLFRPATLETADPWTGEAHPRRLAFAETFIRFLAARWAPIGADNDPTNLNVHWAKNVLAIYAALLTEVDLPGVEG